MHQMAKSSVFLSGMGGLGIEIGRLNIKLLHNIIYKVPSYLNDLHCQLWFDLTSGFTAKNIVLAGVKVCTFSLNMLVQLCGSI